MKKMMVVSAIMLLLAGCSKKTDDLIQDLYSESSARRFQAASALVRKQGDPETVAKLIPLLHGDNELVSYMVIPILGSLADTTAIDPLGDITLNHENSEFRVRAAWSLGSIGHETAIPYLAKALEDPDPDVRYRAVLSLGFMHDQTVLSPIYSMFRDEADSVRAAAIQSLYYYRSQQGSGVLAADLAVTVNDPSEQVRYVAVQALGGGFPDSTVAGELLIESLDDENKFVRVEAIKSLNKIKYAPAVPILKQMYDTSTVDEEVAISEAIKQITDEDYPPLDAGN